MQILYEVILLIYLTIGLVVAGWILFLSISELINYNRKEEEDE